MAQPDLNLQLEQLRERLIALKREAVVRSAPVIVNRRPNTLFLKGFIFGPARS